MSILSPVIANCSDCMAMLMQGSQIPKPNQGTRPSWVYFLTGTKQPDYQQQPLIP